MALDQIRKAMADGILPSVVLADAGYGADMKFQTGLLELGLDYIVGIQPNSSVWTDGKTPLPAKSWSGQGRPPKRLQRSEDHQPILAKNLALSLPALAWQDVTWRAGTQGDLTSRFTAQPIRPAHRDYEREQPWPELWLLIERPEDEDEPTKFWFANLPAKGGSTKPSFRLPVREKTFKPSGSPHQARTPRRPIHRHHALAHRHPTRSATAPMSMLTTGCRYTDTMFMTQ